MGQGKNISSIRALKLNPKLVKTTKIMPSGWSSCVAKDHVHIIKCHKCQRFENIQGECREEETWEHCAGQRDTIKCPNDECRTRCANCAAASIGDDDHEAISGSCHNFLRRAKDSVPTLATVKRHQIPIRQINLQKSTAFTGEIWPSLERRSVEEPYFAFLYTCLETQDICANYPGTPTLMVGDFNRKLTPWYWKETD